MKVLRRGLVGIALCFAFVFLLASCLGSKVSKSYANDINKAAMDKNYVTVETAKKDLGKECNDWTIGGNGLLFAIKGYDNIEDEKAFNKLVYSDEKAKYEVIIIKCLDEKCVSAYYVEGTGEEVSAKLEDAIL